jgi:NAD(P)-dependent dehydrogenase (short-subunit alcohol dehydrogenase family)
MVQCALGRYAELHLLVNNAGITRRGQTRGSWDVPDDLWDEVIRVNLRSVFVCSRAAIPAIEAAGGGAIVNVASIAATVSASGSAAYAASKSGILGFSRQLAVELAPTIRVNCVSPGYMRTPMSTGERSGLSVDDQQSRMEQFASKAPMGRVGEVDDIASAILYLASEDASFVTGDELVVDGGHLARSN